MPVVIDSLTPKELKDEWCTLPALYERLDREFGFRYDFAATNENALSDNYFTKEKDALDSAAWFFNPMSEPIGFLNPPFSMTYKFLAKAAEQIELAKLNYGYGLICCLVKAAAPETKWFRHHAIDKHGVPKHELRYLYPRVPHVNHEGVVMKSNMFPSMLIIMRTNPWNHTTWVNWK